MKMDVKTIGVLFVIVLVIAGVAYMGMRPETPSEEAEEVPNGSPTSQEPSETTPETPGEESVTLKIPPRPEAPYIPEGTPYGWAANYTKIYSNDFESATYPGVVVNGELVTEGVLDGVTSVKLSQYQGIETDPTLLPLEGDTYYVFELDYRIIDAGSGEYPLWIVIDNLRIFRLDPLPVTSPPERWERLAELSYPRLGNYQLGTPLNWAEGTGMAPDWPEDELVHELDEYLEKLSLFDVVAGPAVSSQTKETFFVKGLRELNPDIVIVPYMIYAETDCFFEPPRATIDLTYDFYSGLPQQWVMEDTRGGPLECVGFPGQFIMNIFDDCPTVGGQTYTDAVIDHMVDDVMASGIWDGIMIDNTVPNVNHYIPDSQKS
jgi:hypothetical protein